MHAKRFQSGEALPFFLSASRRQLLLERITELPPEYRKAIRRKGPLNLPLLDSYYLGHYIAAEAGHTKDENLQSTLDGIVWRILTAGMLPLNPVKKLDLTDPDRLVAPRNRRAATWAKAARFATDSLGITTKIIRRFPLAKDGRVQLAMSRGIPARLKKMLREPNPKFTFGEVIRLVEVLVTAPCNALERISVWDFCSCLLNWFRKEVVRAAKPKKSARAASRN